MKLHNYLQALLVEMKASNEIVNNITIMNAKKQKVPTVLLFDSGVGGLSVYQEIEQILPALNYIYSFDNQGFPYGEKTEQYIIERAVKIIETISQHHPLDLIVIACNTASTIVLPALREKFTCPIVGVVPAIKPAVKLTENGVIGLLATKATVSRQYTQDLINQFAKECMVELLGVSRLVEIAEDKLHGVAVHNEEIREILQPWFNLKKVPDTIVLGCTHFPLIRDEIKAVLPKNVHVIDSGAAIARRVATLLPEVDKASHAHGSKIAICTELTEKVQRLKPVLAEYGLTELREYRID